MRLDLPWSRQGHPTVAHRFIGGFRHASRMQPREGRQNSTPSPEVPFGDPLTSREFLSSLKGLLASAALAPTIETVGYYRVSLAGQRKGDREMRSRSC